MSSPSEQYDLLLKEEEELVFPHFVNEDAYALAQIIVDRARSDDRPLGIEIELGGLIVFRYYPTGIYLDHQMWLARKRNTVHLRDSSSQRLTAFFSMNNATLADWKLDPNQYCLDGGGFPIRVCGTGVIGSICASGYAGHEDHAVIVEAIKTYLAQ